MKKLSLLFLPVFVLCSFVVCALVNKNSAAEEAIREIPYPSGKSYPQVTNDVVIPYFDSIMKTPLKLDKITFSLRNFLYDKRKKDPHHNQDMDVFLKQLNGSTVDFQAGEVTLANGNKLSLENYTTPLGLALSFAAYDMNQGLILNFSPMKLKAYYVPISPTHIREYTIYPDHTFWDRTYNQVCNKLEHIKNRFFYFDIVDFAISGHVDFPEKLSFKQQTLITDLVAISIAEYFLEHKKSFYAKGRLKSRTGPIYNALLTSLYNHGTLQITTDAEGTRVTSGNCRYFQGDVVSSDWHLKYLNEQLITRAIMETHPYDFSFVSARLGNAYSDNFFNMLAYIFEHPEKYDGEVRMSLKRIIVDFPVLAGLINSNIMSYLKSQPSNQALN